MKVFTETLNGEEANGWIINGTPLPKTKRRTNEKKYTPMLKSGERGD
jgi:hypothetical protein